MEDLTPLYNKELYLAYLCGEDVVLPIPDGNAERYLAYLCGMDVTIPDVPDGRTETYLAYKCGEDVVLPDPMYRIEYYLAKWCGIDCEVPEPLYRIEYWLAQLANSGELKTVTGNPISVSDALAKPAESLTIEILPQQSGSGDPSPDNVRPISGFTGVNIHRTGKNVWDEEWEVGSINGTTGLDYDADATRIRSKNYISVVPNTTYYGLGRFNIFEYGADKSYIKNSGFIGVADSGSTFTTSPSTHYIRFHMSSAYGTTYNNNLGINYPSTATAYAPYTGTTYPISWQTEAGTVYGGSLDVTTGVLTVTHGIIDMSVVNWIRDNNRAGVFYGGITGRSISSDVLACSCYKVDNISVSTSKDAYISGVMSYGGNMVFFRDTTLAGKTRQEVQTARSGETIVYELATPQTYQLTPTEVQMLLGNNVIWNDVGDMVLEYLADGPADDIDALQILLGNRYVNNGEPDEATDKEALEILLGGNTR